jgi:hypothetical protein
MKKKKIDTTPDGEHGFSIFSLSANVDDFRLAFLLNKQLDIKFEREDNLMVYTGPKCEPVPFSFYHYNRDKQTCFYLIQNLKEQQPLMKNYFLLINGFFTGEDKAFILTEVEQIPDVLSVSSVSFPVSPGRQKSAKKTQELINAIITDLEYHNIEINKRKNESKVKLRLGNTRTIKKLYN